MWLPPGQSRNAVVMCYIPPNMEIGTKDKITFSSQGLNLASQSAVLTVTSPLSAGLVRRFGRLLIQFFYFQKQKSFTLVFVGDIGSKAAVDLLEIW